MLELPRGTAAIVGPPRQHFWIAVRQHQPAPLLGAVRKPQFVDGQGDGLRRSESAVVHAAEERDERRAPRVCGWTGTVAWLTSRRPFGADELNGGQECPRLVRVDYTRGVDRVRLLR